MSVQRDSTQLPAERDQAPVMPLRIGERYQVIEQLGRGGMAVVYRVRDRHAAQDVALKQLSLSGARRDRELNALFEHEFIVLAQLRHPGVIEVYDYGVDPSGPFYTMELLDGGDVNGLAPLPYVDACRLMIGVCSSLSLLHSRKLLHRDISPANVRCTRTGTAKLIDFGAMVPMGPCTRSVGTPAFVAPEVVHHLDLDARTDLFSLGATLYYTITGQRPFAAHTLAELSRAWQTEPVAPGLLVAGVPSALDELLLSLLRIDPARRPRTAFEVMQRLAAIAGVEHTEASTISRAYLSTPTLVGRAVEQRRFRQCLRRATHGAGAGLVFEGAAGAGRSRLLDSCLLEAKTSGALVLRLAGRSAAKEALTGVHALAEQLLAAMPGSVRDTTYHAGVFHGELTAAQSTLELQPREALAVARDTTQSVLLAWFRSVSEGRLLVIGVDDIDHIDEPSIAFLLALLHAGGTSRLQVLATLETSDEGHSLTALAVLRRHCSCVRLAELTDEQIQALFASVFFDVPHVALLSSRIAQRAAGRPREALALAHYLLDSQRVRYEDGNWVLPAELPDSELPINADDVLRLRIGALSPLARRLAEHQALALDETWTRSDYLELVATADHPELDAALASLQQQGVLTRDGDSYALSQLGARSGLLRELSAAQRSQCQRELAQWSARRGRPGLFEVHHWLCARASVPALDRMLQLLDDTTSAASLRETSSLPFKLIADIVQRAHAAAVEQRRRPREISELLRLLLELSIATDSTLYYQYAPHWREQLESDSGLFDYEQTDAGLPNAARVQEALQRAAARYEALPEAQRVYRLDQAIKYLAHDVAIAIAIGSRRNDTALLAALPAVLAPFAELSPLLFALWQNTIAVSETIYQARFEQARLRLLDVHARLEGVSNRDVPYVDAIRLALAHGIAAVEVTLGYRSAEHWIEVMEQSSLQRGNALFLRRALCLFEGDTTGAERLRKQAEVLTLTANARQVFDAPLSLELMAQVHAGDLAGVKQVAENIARRAAEWPGWVVQQHLAQGYYQQLRGDLPAAKAEFECVLALTDPDRADPPPQLRTWVNAVAGYITVLTDLGAVAEACSFGVTACERSVALGITGAYNHTRALALAEAKLGHYERAADRLDRIILERAGRNPALVAVDLEARARVAILAHDQAAALRFGRLATYSDRVQDTAVQVSRRGRLLDAAKRAGIALSVPESGFESVVLGNSLHPNQRTNDPELKQALEALREPETRAQRTLELICGAARNTAGELYQLQPSGHELIRSATRGAALDGKLEAFVNGYLRAQREQAELSQVFTTTARPNAFEIISWTSPSGKAHAVVVLQHALRDHCLGVVTLQATADSLRTPSFSALLQALSARLSELA